MEQMLRPTTAVLALILLLGGCSGSGREVDSQGPLPEVIRLTYLDIDAFDSRLADAMENRAKRIEVRVSYGFPVNDIPPRIGKWLSAIEEAGGEVKLAPLEAEETDTRGLAAGLIPVAIQLYNVLSEKRQYSHSEDYPLAVLAYDETEGRVTRLTFLRTGRAQNSVDARVQED